MNEPKRQDRFARNSQLEALLAEVNARLNPASVELTHALREEVHPKVFIIGPLRSGTTLFTQWLANSGLVACPTNMLSRFYAAPVIGARIQQLLTDPRYDYGAELADLSGEIGFSSENGKTRGALAPHEFWYFWRRFLPFDERDFATDGEIARQGNMDGLRDELNALANVFGKPFALKAMIMNQNLPSLAAKFERALFIHLRRDPVYNIQSALEARRRQYGDISQWYSFRIREYEYLRELSPLKSVAGQIAATRRSIEKGLRTIPRHHSLTVQYETFCENPGRVFEEITEKLAGLGMQARPGEYGGPERFAPTNAWRLSEYTREEAASAWDEMRAWAEAADPGSRN